MGLEDMARRSLQRAGEPLTITEYTESGTDDHGDPLFTDTTTTGVGLFRKPGREEQEIQTTGGVVRNVDALVFVSSEHSGELVAAGDDTPRASTITRTATDEKFTAIDVWDENNGQLRVFCNRVTE